MYLEGLSGLADSSAVAFPFELNLLTLYNMTYEEKRKIPVKFIVTTLFQNETHYMCKTNWSKSYSVGVLEFDNEKEAIVFARDRTENGNYSLQAYNDFGERIQ